MARMSRVFSVVSTFAVLVVPLMVGVPAAGADPTVEVFTTSGEFTVPAGVCEVTATATGEQGENWRAFGFSWNDEAWGGWGVSARSLLAVSPGEVLGVNVDVGGGAGGAVHNAEFGSAGGGEGGGASDVRRSPFGLADRVLIGGGGGGGGGHIAGGVGSQSALGGPAGGGPADNWYIPATYGNSPAGDVGSWGRGADGAAGSGTEDSRPLGGSGGDLGLLGGGSGGSYFPTDTGSGQGGDGVLGAGGAGGTIEPGSLAAGGGGGGGGGLYGGGGGAGAPWTNSNSSGSGGGGGSSFGPEGATFTLNVADLPEVEGDGVGRVQAPGSVTIAWEPLGTCPDETGPNIEVTTPADGAVLDRGQPVAAGYSCVDEAGGSGVDTCVGTVADGDPVDMSSAGDHDFTVTGTDAAGNETVVTTTYTVRDLDLSIELFALETMVAPGETIHYGVQVTGFDYRLTGATVTDSNVPDCARDLPDLALNTIELYGCTHVAAVGDGPTFTNTATVASDQSAPIQSNPVDVAVAIPAGSGLISGTVTESGSGEPVPDARVAVLRAADFSLAWRARTDADGGYVATVPAGDYYLYVLDADHADGFFGPPAHVTVTDGGTATADPAVAARTGSVTGTVSDSSGPRYRIWVVALGPGGALAADTDTAPDGSYTLAGLDTGSYRIRFVDPYGVYPSVYYDGTNGYGNATPVTVTGGAATTGIDATLTTGG